MTGRDTNDHETGRGRHKEGDVVAGPGIDRRCAAPAVRRGRSCGRVAEVVALAEILEKRLRETYGIS